MYYNTPEKENQPPNKKTGKIHSPAFVLFFRLRHTPCMIFAACIAAFCGFFNAFSVYSGECPRCGRAHAERAMLIKAAELPQKIREFHFKFRCEICSGNSLTKNIPIFLIFLLTTRRERSIIQTVEQMFNRSTEGETENDKGNASRGHTGLRM